jgi:alkylation response protein AidB-like acyl-CoA dehydrogenase
VSAVATGRRSPLGRPLADLAETLAAEIAPRAAQHDREGTFPGHSLAAVKRSGYLTAPIPEELGGLGVGSVRDVVLASSRLAQGDASLTLGVNMHLVFVLNVVRRRAMAVAAGEERRARAFGETLATIARDGIVYAAAISERGQDLGRPATTARRTDEGWIVTGHKIFCTMASAADVLYAAVTFLDAGRRELYGYALVPRTAAGVVIHDDWDALGMRASGSDSVTFEDVRLPAAALRGGFPVGDVVGYMERNVVAGLFHGAVALGIAESAHALATRRLAGPSEVLAADSVVELTAARATLTRAASLVDEHDQRNLTSAGTPEQVTALFAEAQAAKTFVADAATRVVDRSLTLSGGAGYLEGSPLARAYRDVRATAFMNPLGATRARAFLGRLAAGAPPTLLP